MARALLLSSLLATTASFQWLVVGGGPQGVHVAGRLLREVDGLALDDVCIVDDEDALLRKWKTRAENTGMRYLRAYSLPALRPGLRTRHTLHAPTTHALVAAATPAAGDDAPPAAELRGGASGEPGGTLVLLGAVVMLFVSRTAASSAGIAPIQKELGLSASTVGVLQSAYLAGYALTNAPGGAIATVWAGAVMLACLAAWSVSVALMPVAAASPAPVAALVALRLLFGLARAGAARIARVVSRWLPPRRSSGIADAFVFFNAGNAAGLLLGGLIPVLGWRALMVGGGAAGLAWGAGGSRREIDRGGTTRPRTTRPRPRRRRPAASRCARSLGLELSKSAGLSALPMVTMALGSKPGKILGFTNTVGVFVGIVANVVTGRVLEATAFRACFALAAAIYAEFAVFFGFVRGGRLV
ncbi:hypothetical protein JL722_11803 [Aureococcus anophagefferens]|nr:hypothetical protein JL722_11803 [Aureococcus anophagefferens]